MSEVKKLLSERQTNKKNYGAVWEPEVQAIIASIQISAEKREQFTRDTATLQTGSGITILALDYFKRCGLYTHLKPKCPILIYSVPSLTPTVPTPVRD